MKIENATAQMRKGVLEYCTLSILSEKDYYASDIINKLKDANLIVVEGTMYPMLTRLKNAEYLSYRWEESTQGPPRKYYELSAKGNKFLKELHSSWTDFVEAVNSLNPNIK